MIDPENLIRVSLVGNPRFPRYVVTFTPYPFLSTLD